MSQNEMAVAAVNGTTLTIMEFLRYLKINRKLRPLATRALTNKAIEQAAKQAGVAIDDRDLQQAANQFRRRFGLLEAEQTARWLDSEGLTAEDLEAGLVAELLPIRWREHLLSTRGPSELAARPERYARACIIRLTVPSADAARELLLQVREEGRDFLGLAVEQAGGPGIAGPLVVLRCQLPAAIADLVFAAAPGDIVGPATTAAGSVLIQVRELLPAVLDEQSRPVLAEDLYRAWLAEQLGGFHLALAATGSA